jgi:hypothetical protein
MHSYFLYQQADTSQTEKKEKKDSIILPQANTFPIDLMEEVDDMSIKEVVKPKKPRYTNVQQQPQTNTLNEDADFIADTANFGLNIKKLYSLPVREVDVNKVVEDTTTVTKQELVFTPEHRKEQVHTWQTIILLFCFLLFGLAKAFNSLRIKLIVRSVFTSSGVSEAIRSEKMFFNQANILLHIVAFFSLSLFLYDFLLYKDIFYRDTSFFFMKVFAIVIVLYIIKQIFGLLINNVFDFDNLKTAYVYLTSIHTILIGVILLPLMVLNYYSFLHEVGNYKMFMAGLVIIVFIINLLRLFFMGRQKNISIFHIILYLCTLEILPLIVVISYFIF